MEWSNGLFRISDSKSRIDLDFVTKSLQNSYWAGGRSRETIEKSIENSVFLSLFREDRQIGFARLVGDQACFAWLCDVFIDEEYRGRGLGKFLMQSVVEHPITQVSLTVLATRDAHGLYEKYGFSRREFMQKRSRPVDP